MFAIVVLAIILAEITHARPALYNMTIRRYLLWALPWFLNYRARARASVWLQCQCWAVKRLRMLHAIV